MENGEGSKSASVKNSVLFWTRDKFGDRQTSQIVWIGLQDHEGSRSRVSFSALGVHLLIVQPINKQELHHLLSPACMPKPFHAIYVALRILAQPPRLALKRVAESLYRMHGRT